MTEPYDEPDPMDPDVIADNAWVLASGLMDGELDREQHTFRDLEFHPHDAGGWEVHRVEHDGGGTLKIIVDYVRPDNFGSAQLLADHIVALQHGSTDEWPERVRRSAPDD